MKAIGRIFILIWLIVFIILSLLGGFILFPIIRYIIYGDIDDPMYVLVEIYFSGKDIIEAFFDHSNINLNNKFWK